MDLGQGGVCRPALFAWGFVMAAGGSNCGAGSSMGSQGQCIGTGGGNMQPLANVTQGVAVQPVVGGVVSFGAVIATVLFAAFAVAVVAGVVRSRRDRAAVQASAGVPVANSLEPHCPSRFDSERGVRLSYDAHDESDAEDDTEDDSPNDDADFLEA